MIGLSRWSRGIRLSKEDHPVVFAYLWFYEWNLFEAVREGQHTPGRRDFDWRVGEREAEMVSDVFGISAQASPPSCILAAKICLAVRGYEAWASDSL